MKKETKHLIDEALTRSKNVLRDVQCRPMGSALDYLADSIRAGCLALEAVAGELRDLQAALLPKAEASAKGKGSHAAAGT